jgi:hypothetical protein
LAGLTKLLKASPTAQHPKDTLRVSGQLRDRERAIVELLGRGRFLDLANCLLCGLDFAAFKSGALFIAFPASYGRSISEGHFTIP